MRPRESYGIGQLDELIAWCKDNAVWASCAVCERAVRQCLVEGDGPIRIRRVMLDANRDGPRPICARCLGRRAKEVGRTLASVGGPPTYATTKEMRDVARIDWSKPQPGSDTPLRDEAVELRKQGLTWQQIADELNERYGLRVGFSGVQKLIMRYAPGTVKGTPQASSDVVGRAPVARQADGRSDGAASAGSKPAPRTRPIQDGCATDGAAVQEEGGERPQAGSPVPQDTVEQALLLPRHPILVHVAKPGMEVWVSARSQDEMRVKAAEITNMLSLVVNMGEGA